jgi:hypothetical protein
MLGGRGRYLEGLTELLRGQLRKPMRHSGEQLAFRHAGGDQAGNRGADGRCVEHGQLLVLGFLPSCLLEADRRTLASYIELVLEAHVDGRLRT